MYKDRSLVKSEAKKTRFTKAHMKAFELLAEYHEKQTATIIAEYAVEAMKRDIEKNPEVRQMLNFLMTH